MTRCPTGAAVPPFCRAALFLSSTWVCKDNSSSAQRHQSMGRPISETLISILGRRGLVRTLAHGLSARKSTKTTDGSTCAIGKRAMRYSRSRLRGLNTCRRGEKGGIGAMKNIPPTRRVRCRSALLWPRACNLSCPFQKYLQEDRIRSTCKKIDGYRKRVRCRGRQCGDHGPSAL
jgi:hypothetical protein